MQDAKQKKVAAVVENKATAKPQEQGSTSDSASLVFTSKAKVDADYHRILSELRASPSYRLGYALAWLPRTFLTFFRFSAENGVGKALQLMRTTDYLAMTKDTDYATIKAIKASRTYRLGRLCTMPMRWARATLEKNSVVEKTTHHGKND